MENKNKKQKTVFGGIGIALLLCALMVLMPMSGFVDNTSADAEFVENNPAEDDIFSLPDRIDEPDYEHDPATELLGLRGETTKTFVNDDGTFTQMVTSEPIHYLTEDSVWSDINLNIQPTLEGWEVTQNSFETRFAPEAAGGIAVQANQWVDPILSGLNPGVVGLGELHDVPEFLDVAPAHKGVDVGGDTIRYPLAESIELDYTVTTVGVKQNMILREQPIIPEHINHFGLSEQLMLPSDYVLFAGEQQVGEEFVQTQEGLQIRHEATGDLLAEIPAPVVLEADSAEPYMGTFVVRTYGPTVLLITVVEADWLLDDDRTYPISIDPTLNVGSASGGDCYVRYGSCTTSTWSDHYKYYSSYYYVPWHKFTFTSANSMLPGATVEKIEWKKSVTYASWSNTGVVDVKVLEDCGLDATGNYAVSTNNCTGSPIAASKLASAGSYSTNGRSLIASIGNSPVFATVSAQSTGTKTAVMCNTAASCNSTTGAVGHVTSALANLGTIGIGEFVPSSNYTNYDTSNTGSSNNRLLITYSGGIDTVAPTAEFAPYTGIDSYIEGVRTLFIEISDNAFGIDTTASGGPTLHYSTDGGTTWSSTTYGLGTNNEFDAGEVVSIGTCGATDNSCRFKARTPDLAVGDNFQYYWEFEDNAPTTQNPPGPNTGYEPALTGTQTTPTPYEFEIVDWETAPWEHKKMVTLATDVHASSYYTPQGFLDRQMTYYTHSDEYFFEFDTSSCGTGSQQCWYTGTSTFYGNWIARWNNNPPSGSYGMNSGSTSGNQYLRNGEGGFIQVDAQHGPGMNLIYYYDNTSNAWGVVGVDTETGIDTPLTGGSSMDASLSYGYASAYKFSIPSNFTGTHGHFDFNSTGSYTNVIYTDTLDTVTGVTVTNGGTGHSTASDVATTTSGSGSGLTLDVTASTGVTGLSVTSQGTNFSDATNVSTTTSGSGTGLTVDVTVTSTTVNNTTTTTTAFTVNTAGSGYAVGDTITVSSGVTNATDATLSVASIDGIVTAVAVNDAGSGYAVSDTVTLSSSGVAATITVASITDVRTYANTTTDLADRVCVTTNGWTYFYKSGSYDRCTPAYYMIYGSTSSYRWSGFALGSGYYGRQAATGTMTYKVGYVAPLPDIYEPEVEHTALGDSHASTRVVSVVFKDAGDPASGLNTTQTPGVGPTMYYRIGGTSGTWTSSLMDAQGVSDPDDCQLGECVWTADIEDIEVNDTVEYYFTARDVSTESTGVNTVTSPTYNFTRGDPNKVFIVEWRDRSGAYLGNGPSCTVQALFYDVTNEIEYKYDSNCRAYRNGWSIGYMDQGRTNGASIAYSSATGYNSNPGYQPTTTNFRISTDGADHAYESFDLGLVPLNNAESTLSGNSGGGTYYSNCMYSWRWSSYKNSCNANIDIPAGFEFEYFGTTYDGNDTNDRIQIGRQGYMYFISNGNTNTERGIWTSNNPELPYNSNSIARPGLIAPFWSNYNNAYCTVNTNVDCTVYYRIVPYNGKGTDVSADITSNPNWDIEDSPIRINPVNDYLVVSSDLTINPGVEIEIAPGKGISFDGSCTQFTAIGEEDNPINFTGMNGGEWLGIAFTDDCATAGGTDDRHQLSFVNFNNTSDAVIRSGSRHNGQGPSCGSSTANCNTGNYTMSDVTFTNVGSVFSHGSGQGTVLTMTDFTISGVDGSCFNLPEDSRVTLMEGTMTNCNTDGGVADGAVVSVLNSNGGGLLHMENITASNAYQNFVRIDLEDLFMSNVSLTNTGTGYTKYAIEHTPWRTTSQTGSTAYLSNVDVPSYGESAYIDAMESLILMDVDLGDNDLEFRPGGASQNANGPSSSNAIFDGITSGDLTMDRVHPGTFNDITAGDVLMTGNAITSEILDMTNFDIGSFSVTTGCGWTMTMDAPTLHAFKSSSSCPTSKNTVTISDATFNHGSLTTDVIDGRNSHITVGESSITSSTANNTTDVGKARAGTNLVLIDVSLNGTDCADANGATDACSVDVATTTSNPSMVYYGGLASVRTYRITPQGPAWKADHVVTTTLVDSSMNEMFQIGSHVTDANGNASVWVVVEDSDETPYEDTIIRAFGVAGTNETYPDDYPDATLASDWYNDTFTWGDHLDLKLVPAPITFDDPTLDCQTLVTTWTNLTGNYDPSTKLFTFDDTTITVAADLTLDGCGIVMQGGALKVQSSATTSPVITLAAGTGNFAGSSGSITANDAGTSGTPASIRAVSSTYGLHLDIEEGTLTLDNAVMRNIAQDATLGAALYIGGGAELVMSNGATIYGDSASSDEMATVMVQGGSADISDSSIINDGASGTALWLENTGATASGLTVRNAAVGIQSHNAAPEIDNFVSNGNTVGLSTYGGMSLPTIYRSSALSGQSAGWTTYEFDLSNYLGKGNYLQLGANSIYGGGNAHPSYNFASSKYYFITDRYNVEITDDNGNTWNITSDDQVGYYPYSASDPAEGVGPVGTYSGGTGGAPSWHCNYYAADYNPNYFREGYFYYLYRGWLGQSSGYSSYDRPDQFGFDWESLGDQTPTSGTYPYRYWGYNAPTYQFSGVYQPPEGPSGVSTPRQPGNFEGSQGSQYYPSWYQNYGVCLDYAYTYYISSGQGARMTMPIVDISAGNISKISMWIDVLHRGNDNYQDRYDFVARVGNDPSDLGDYLRESGTPSFTNGTITGAEYGVEIGGAFAAGNYEDITVTDPLYAGLHITGQAASTVNRFNVTDGDYGVLVASSASGSVHMTNLDLDDQGLAGIYYLTDLSGDLTGSSISGSDGAAFKYGPNTDDTIELSGLTVSGNALGIDAGGSGEFTLTDVTLSNTQDVNITGSSVMHFIEGTVDTSLVAVTSTGLFNRQRQVDITVNANVSNVGQTVSDTLVVLKDSEGVVQGQVETDTSGVAEGITFTTQTVDASGVTTNPTTGYTAVTVSLIGAYSYVSQNDNNGDFRYDFMDLTLTDTSGQSSDMYLEDTFTARLCYSYTSSSYIYEQPCTGLSTSGERTFSNGMTEYGYYYAFNGNDLEGETVMMDAPFLYVDDGNQYWNGSTWIVTASYDYYATNRMYPYYYANVNTYFSDSTVTTLAVSDTGNPQGFSLGYLYYSMNLMMNNTSISGLATIYGSIGYGYYPNYQLEWFDITNSSFTHFRGYREGTSLNYEDTCISMVAGNGTSIMNNTFDNCMIGVLMDLSPYSYSHSSSVYGADNLVISGNTFLNGGEVADVYGDPANNVDGLVVENNVMNPTQGGSGVAIQSGNAADVTIANNTINNAADGVYLRDVSGFSIENNDISGVSDPSETGILVFGGNGDVTGNDLTDADGGIYLLEMEAPPSPTNALCEIGRNDYGRGPHTCTWTLAAGKEALLNLGTDSWGYEISISVAKPDGTTQSWPTYSFASNTQYTPLATFTDAGSYTLTVRDSWGDGGATITVLESSTGSNGYAGPEISDNTIALSNGRTSPNAQGIAMIDCDGVTIQSMDNTITLEDNAFVIEDCDANDQGSTLTGADSSSTNGILADDTNSALVLNGTTISGFATGVFKEGGTLTMIGDADLTGSDYAVYADDVMVYAIDASVDGGASGTGLHVVNSDDVWVYPMDASGLVGMYVENSPFRWDGGETDATTALSVVDATGTVENMTWSAATTQIDAGVDAHVTSIGNTLDVTKINVHTSAVIDEANLMSVDTTHLGAAPTAEVALMLMSTDNERASYVSTSFQPEVMSVDGLDTDWVGGNALNPSGYAMPGNMSGDGTDNFLVTYIEGDGLYLGLTDTDISTSDVLIYLSVDGSGSDVGYNGLGGAHNLPFNANYVLWADSDSSYDLYSYGFLGWGQSSLSSANVDADFSTSLAELYIPWSRLGGMPDHVDIVAIVQAESTADISVVHPTQTLDSQNTLQNLTKFVTVELTHDDLPEGELDNEVLVYRSYKGSTSPSAAKEYNLMVKTDADCAMDWAVVEDISMATNVVFDDAYTAGTGETTDVRATINMERACPVIDTDGTDPTTDGLVDFTRDEDSGTLSFSLTNLADDVQDEEADLTWTVTEGTLVAHDNVLVDWTQTGQDVTITPLTDQFGTVVFSFEVVDSNGLVDDHNITFTVDNVNDAPVICNVERQDCMPILSEDDGFNNILPEGFGTHTKFLGDVSNTTRSYIRDMANEQAPTRQVYNWSAMAYNDDTTDACSAFSVDIVSNELTITENTNNELGGLCDIVLGLSDDGDENSESETFTVEFSVSPVNDAPVIKTWNRTTEAVMVANNGSIPALPWSISLMEDDTNTNNLTYNLTAIKTDVDHEMDDLTWTVESTDQCVYTNYFTTSIVGDLLVFDLIPDATTNANDWEIDYLNNNGIHQIGPSGSEYCQIRLVLRDTAGAPSYVPNYDTTLMPIADYQQGLATKEIGVRVENVREQVPDYAFNDVSGFSFNGVTNVMSGTYVPVTVTVDGGGDEGPYRYDHMLAVTFHTDGHADLEQTRYYTVPAYGESVDITEYVYVTRDTTHVWVEMDVLTCLTNPCDLTVTTADRFQADEPASHYAIINNVQSTDAWSKPGQYGKDATSTSQRRPLLEDSNWCNNIMTSLETADVCNHANMPASNFLSTDQNLPAVVDTIGASSVPSFAPSIVAVALSGLFVSALTLSGRRADDEEEVTAMVDDDAAVSPVIATILMVAITVVLSGVIYVWASSLAETDVKGVPRVTFDIEDIDGYDADTGHWLITVQQAQTELATQAVVVKVLYTNATGSLVTHVTNLADSGGVYGFSPYNSDAFVTFVDSVNVEQISEDERRSISTFNTGDSLYVRTHAPDGTPLEDATITLSYAPPNGDGALLRTWSDLSYDRRA